jgi:hypothetical protein
LATSTIPGALTLASGLALPALDFALIGAALIILLALGTIDFAITIIASHVVLGEAKLHPHHRQHRCDATGQAFDCGPAVSNIGDRPCPAIKPAIVHASLPG